MVHMSTQLPLPMFSAMMLGSLLKKLVRAVHPAGLLMPSLVE
jgi:hypothetical protein